MSDPPSSPPDTRPTAPSEAFAPESEERSTPPEARPTVPDGRGTVLSPPSVRMPVLFVAHGAPVLLDDLEWVAQLAGWARAIPKPKAVLMVSAHWEERPTTLGATVPVPLVYDFVGFPEKYYRTEYAAPGAPDLATRVRSLLRENQVGFGEDPTRGLDHGAYVPLVAMYPQADVPVLQVSMPGLDPLELFALGRALSPLRDEGVLVVGSGFLVHNMQYAFRPGVPEWAREFDAWAGEAIERFDIEALLDVYGRAPGAQVALPTWEHYAPLLVAAGAVGQEQPSAVFPITGFWMGGAFTRRSVQFD
jgi:4,5-DOPA dioxygenase extradiol